MPNQNKPKNEQTNISDELPYIGTPEDLFIVNPKADKEIYDTALTCALSRAQATVDLLIENGEQGHFILDHDSIFHALSSIDGSLKQMKQMIYHSFGAQKK